MKNLENQTFTVVLSRKVNDAVIDCIYSDGKTWFAGSQICEALEYANPQKAAATLYSKNKERLSTSSRRCQIDTPSGKQDEILYNVPGMIRLCWSSRKPKSDAVMGALCHLADIVAILNCLCERSADAWTSL